MTKEITKANVIQEISDKFKLREFVPANFLFDETVVPIYDIERHLEYTTADRKTVSITSTGGILLFEVPNNERWELHAYTLVFVGAGAYTVAGVYLVRKKQVTSSSFVYLDLTAGQTVGYAINLPKSVRLDPGDAIYVNIDGYTSTQDLRLYIDYQVETIR